MGETLLILGASARAAAQSSRRAGFTSVCGDLFADLDLRECATATSVADFPSGLVAVARAAPPGPWMYTGGLENYPALVERITATRPLLGNPAAVLRRVRDPFLTTDKLRCAGLDVPECQAQAPVLFRCEPGTPPQRWLCKGRRSSGGNQVHFWRASEPQASNEGQSYFQQWIKGQSCGAVYVAAGREARLLGVTEQLLASSETNERETDDNHFRYAGSVGPLPLSPGIRTTFERIGQTLSREFELTGLFGVDAILDGDRVWPVEVNPRYPASAEIIDWALKSWGPKSSVVGWHFTACRDGELPVVPMPTIDRWHGKRICFARREMVISAEFVKRAIDWNAGRPWPAIADIPAPETRFCMGQPIFTILAEGPSRELVLERLSEVEHELSAVLSSNLPRSFL